MELLAHNSDLTVNTWEPVPQPPRKRHLRLVEPEDTSPGPEDAWVAGITRAVIEILGGQRSAISLTRHLSPMLLDSLRKQAGTLHLHRAQVLSVRSQRLGPGTIEVAAVVAGQRRSRAAVLRLKRRHDRWRVVSVAIV